VILTIKIPHLIDFSDELRKAKQVARFAINNKFKITTKHVKQFGLKAAISNQIIRKYGNDKKSKDVKNIKLVIPNYHVKVKENIVYIPCLKQSFNFKTKYQYSKINQIEIDNKYFYVAINVQEEPQIQPQGWIGIDRNTTGHCIVASCDKTGKVMMLGKSADHVHKKYRSIRKQLQRLKKYKKLVSIKKRESNITKDMNHKMSTKIVKYAKENNCGIKLEKLTGIRNNKKHVKSFNFSLNSWSFYQFELFTLYKAKLQGVKVSYIEPAYTSQNCSKCGLLEKRSGKLFKCSHCGHTCHSDVNASWNICYSDKLLEEPKPKKSSLTRGCSRKPTTSVVG